MKFGEWYEWRMKRFEARRSDRAKRTGKPGFFSPWIEIRGAVRRMDEHKCGCRSVTMHLWDEYRNRTAHKHNRNPTQPHHKEPRIINPTCKATLKCAHITALMYPPA